ncbi:MAG: cupin-like domain-containing protein [Archangium sp.]
MNDLNRLREALDRGLGPHHDIEGEGAVRVSDVGQPATSLFLTPGSVTLGPSRSPRGTLSLDAAFLKDIVTGMAFDFRLPPYRDRLRFEGDVEFVIRSVVLSLREPPLHLRLLFSHLEKAAAKNPNVLACTAVERIARPSREEARRRLELGVPFVITGALDHWPAVNDFEKWLAKRSRVAMLTLTGTSIQLGDFVGRARTERDVYAYTHGFPLVEALRPDFAPPEYTAGLELSVPQLWMGAGRDPSTPVTTLHRDASLGLLGHVHGRKRFTVYAPHFASSLYPRPGFDSFQQCWVSPHAPDFERYPLFRDARGIDFELEPGDLLVQPPGWFHCVYALTPLTASVSYFA